MFSLIQAAVAPQPGEEGIKLKAVIGYNGNGRGNMVWSPDQGYHNILKLKVKQNIFWEQLNAGCQIQVLYYCEQWNMI